MPSAPVKSVEARVVFFNVRGARFSSLSSWNKNKASVIKRLKRVLNDTSEAKASLYVLAECRSREITDILKAFPGYAAVRYETAGIALMYQKSKWSPGRKWVQTYNKGTHGALISEFTYKANGVRINLVGAHLVPFAWRQSKRETDMKRLLTTIDGWNDPTIVALDSNWSKSRNFRDFVKRYGFNVARWDAKKKTRADYRSTGAFKPGTAIDYMLGNKKVVWRGFTVLMGWGSDHHSHTGQVTVTQ